LSVAYPAFLSFRVPQKTDSGLGIPASGFF
jgi:hypothetical protein